MARAFRLTHLFVTVNDSTLYYICLRTIIEFNILEHAAESQLFLQLYIFALYFKVLS